MQPNKLISGFNQYATSRNNVPYNNNNMLMNNPQFMGSIQSPQFFNKINMMKMEQISKIKNVNDLNMSKNQLAQYIINPYKVERIAKGELLEKYDNLQNTYITPMKEVPKAISDWWNSRTNNPYKNIMKNENYKKDYRSIDELIVHKVSQLDKDEQLLIDEYEKLTKLLETHDDELKVIYSASKKNEYKKEYDYVTKFKYRIKYDPKDYNELKKFYKSEEKKINKETKRLDEMIELLLMSDDIKKEDLEDLQKERNETKQEDTKNIHIDDTCDDISDEVVSDTIEKPKKKLKIKKIETGVLETKQDPIVISNEEIQKYKNKKVSKN